MFVIELPYFTSYSAISRFSSVVSKALSNQMNTARHIWPKIQILHARVVMKPTRLSFDMNAKDKVLTHERQEKRLVRPNTIIGSSV